ncbi:hypothetical protein [Pantoea ananatis]|uniref:hypothetical protein n=1 Tax=Pantoea ananas TaxID=553 RepID=UPI0039B8AD84
MKIVCVGGHSNDAERFARGKRIELVSGAQLLQMIQSLKHDVLVLSPPPPRITPVVVVPPAITTTEIICPLCSSAMVKRTNRRTCKPFLGCSQFPKYKGTM